MGTGTQLTAERAHLSARPAFTPYNRPVMPLHPGTRLGPYEITGRLGERGMESDARTTSASIATSRRRAILDHRLGDRCLPLFDPIKHLRDIVHAARIPLPRRGFHREDQ